jgi:hypothetical protein
MNPPSENNPVRHTQKIKAQMLQIVNHLREDAGQTTEAKARALFATSAEVLASLVEAFDDYEKKGQAAWRSDLMASLPKRRTNHVSRR